MLCLLIRENFVCFAGPQATKQPERTPAALALPESLPAHLDCFQVGHIFEIPTSLLLSSPTLIRKQNSARPGALASHQAHEGHLASWS